MALVKQPIEINFSQGIDTKTDPYQIALGRFSDLQNTVFDKNGQLTKRNGFGPLSLLPNSNSAFVTAFNGNLTAIGNTLSAYAQGSNSWIAKGSIQPCALSTLPLVRSNTQQTQADSVVGSNGLVCTVFTDNIPSGGSTAPVYKYVVADSTTGQNIVQPTTIVSSGGVITFAPRVFLLGNYFVIVFDSVITATHHLQYLAINVTTLQVTGATDISTQYTPYSPGSFDGCVVNNSLYLAWNGSDVGNAIRMTSLDSTLVQHNTISFTGKQCTLMSVFADTTGSTATIYCAFYSPTGTAGYVLAVTPTLVTVLAPTQILSNPGTVLNMTGTAQAGVASVLYELVGTYSYDSLVQTDTVNLITCTQSGTVGSASVVARSLGLASKAFLIDTTFYWLGIYASAYQPTYFLLDSGGNILAKLAYSNGGTWVSTGLPSVSVTGSVAQVAYLYKDLIAATNKATLPAGTLASAIYSQTGVNLARFDLGSSGFNTAEIGNNLHLSGGFLWMYDGFGPVEHGFHLWPDYVEATWSATGGNLVAQPDGATNANAYAYQVTYEWSDNQGNIFRSAPSLPVFVTTTGTGSTGKITVHVPTLRLTYKTINKVKIVVYRWSVKNQTYYRVTSITNPALNDRTVDSIDVVDTLADSSVIGNDIIYTAGGVVENVAAPACSAMALFQGRLFLITAEDPNLLWFSKEVIQSTPVEMSDLLTLYVSPTTSAQGATGPMKCLAPLDDKLILFKKNALYYFNGSGPDNTGANNQFGQPVFITGTVGCSNQNSIVFQPNGLMFQSDKGIWLLGRDLSTSYVGAPVEELTRNATVQSAVNVPGTNQIRFTLSSGITLMYDYYVNQWGTSIHTPALSSMIYQDLHTYINSYGAVFQETPGLYLDGSSPVLMGFKTGWIHLAGLQGYQRAYYLYLIGTYLSPHKLIVQLAFDYNPSPTQQVTIHPASYSSTYGQDPTYGSGTLYGGASNLEQFKIYFKQQRCEAFQISVQEIYDPSYGVAAGPGLTLSGMNCVVGIKKGHQPMRASRQAG